MEALAPDPVWSGEKPRRSWKCGLLRCLAMCGALGCGRWRAPGRFKVRVSAEAWHRAGRLVSSGRTEVGIWVLERVTMSRGRRGHRDVVTGQLGGESSGVTGTVWRRTWPTREGAMLGLGQWSWRYLGEASPWQLTESWIRKRSQERSGRDQNE